MFETPLSNDSFGSRRSPGRARLNLWLVGLLVTLMVVGSSVGGAQEPAADLTSEVMGMLAAEQAQAFAAGADPSSLMLASGQSLAEFLEQVPLSPGRARVPRTGQDISYGDRDDGELQAGVEWPAPRFTDNSDGTVRDSLTGLVWLQDANCFGSKTWEDALESANLLADGQCGLTDGSGSNRWRLPNLRELQSLIDYGEFTPALPTGHPFSGVQSSSYWSSTTAAFITVDAWGVKLFSGDAFSSSKTEGNFVWPVRG